MWLLLINRSARQKDVFVFIQRYFRRCFAGSFDSVFRFVYHSQKPKDVYLKLHQMVFLTASVAAVCSSRVQFEVITLRRRDVWSKTTRYSKQYLFLSFENSSTVCIYSPGAVLPHQDRAYVLKCHKNCSNLVYCSAHTKETGFKQLVSCNVKT